MKLTIGMACFNNYEEVWFTIQALRLYQDLDDVEIIVVDNSNNSNIKNFIEHWCKWNVKYHSFDTVQGTSAPRDFIFKVALGEWVFVMDSHVLLSPGSVLKLKEWVSNNRGCMDLLHGPMLYDNMADVADAMNDEWRSNMWGTWRGGENNINKDPYEIPMHGLGLFGCRKDAWLGFNPKFRGFGGEEGYIHNKFRKAGRRVLCLPFLQWLHHFRAGSVPYPLNLEDRIHNYCIGFEELGLNISPVINHFGKEAVLSVMGKDWLNSLISTEWQETSSIFALDKTCQIPKMTKVYEGIEWKESYATKTLGLLLPGLLASINAKTVVEIGIGNGFLTQCLGRALAGIGGGLLISVDVEDWKGEKAKGYTNELPITHEILIQDSATIYWPKHLKGRTIDLAVVDGDHSYNAVKSDLQTCDRFLSTKGIIIAHDYDEVQNPGVVLAVDEFCSKEGWSKIILPTNFETVDYPAAILQRGTK